MIIDLIAVVLGVLFTLRRLDVRKRVPDQYPHVAREQFELWRARESGAYGLVSLACVLKVVLDYAFLFYAQKAALGSPTIRLVGASIFFSWLGLLLAGFLRAHSARKLRERLQIDLSSSVEPPG